MKGLCKAYSDITRVLNNINARIKSIYLLRRAILFTSQQSRKKAYPYSHQAGSNNTCRPTNVCINIRCNLSMRMQFPNPCFLYHFQPACEESCTHAHPTGSQFQHAQREEDKWILLLNCPRPSHHLKTRRNQPSCQESVLEEGSREEIRCGPTIPAPRV